MDEKDKKPKIKTLFVQNLPYSATNGEFEELFSAIGPLKKCFVVTNKNKQGSCKGVGYVTFASTDDAADALKKSLHLGGRKLSLGVAGEKPADKKKQRKRKHSQTEEQEQEEPKAADDSVVEVKKIETVESENRLSTEAAARTVVVHGVNEEQEVKDAAGNPKQIRNISFSSDADGKKSATILYRGKRDAIVAVKRFKGRKMTANLLNEDKKEKKEHKERKEQKEPSKPSDGSSKKSRLIIRNLAFKCNNEDLKKAFEKFGDVVEVNIPKRNNGVKLGFGIVQFQTVEAASKAVEEMNGKSILGREVAVDWTLPKSKFLKASKEAEAEAAKAKKTDEKKEVMKKEIKEEKESDDEEEDDDEDEDEEGNDSDEDDEIDDVTMNTDDEDADETKSNEVEDEDDDEDDNDSFGSVLDENSEDEELSENEEMDEEDEEKDEEDDENEEEEDDEDDDEEDDDDEVDSENDDEDDDDAESSNDDEDDEEPKAKRRKTETKKPKVLKEDVDEGRTVFIRNVSFDSMEEDLEELMEEKFGEVTCCRIVMDQKLQHSKGTAFVQFKTKDQAEECINAASSSADGIVLDGRKLCIALALPKAKADELRTHQKKEKVDKRNLHLVRVGLVRPGTQEAEGLSKTDIQKRLKVEAMARQKLKNPNIFVSSTRLCIRNIPVSVDDNSLRKLYIKSSGNPKAKVTECRIMRDLDRVGSNGVGKSRGYGFVNFENHEDAFAALKATNNNPEIYGESRRLIVEFSLENRAKLLTKQRRLERFQQVKGAPKLKKYEPKLVAPKDGVKKGLPSHSGAKIRHKARPQQKPAKARQPKQERQPKQKNFTADEPASKKKRKRNKKKNFEITDKLDKLVASYSTKFGSL